RAVRRLLGGRANLTPLYVPVAKGIERCPADAEVACSNHAGRSGSPFATGRDGRRQDATETVAEQRLPSTKKRGVAASARHRGYAVFGPLRHADETRRVRVSRLTQHARNAGDEGAAWCGPLPYSTCWSGSPSREAADSSRSEGGVAPRAGSRC